MFLRKGRQREPLPVTMSGVRMGERLLQLGTGDAAVAGAIAAKVGLSGTAAVAVPDAKSEARARAIASDAGALVDVRIAGLDALPYDDRAFDIVVVHDPGALLSTNGPSGQHTALHECFRVLRHGGRLVTIEQQPRGGLASLLRRPSPTAHPIDADALLPAIEAAGFHPVRVVGEVEGFRFVEGLKARES